MRRLTKDERKIAAALSSGEALRQDGAFRANGFPIGRVTEIERMAQRGFVALETVGRSVFASLTDAGRRALEE